MSRSIDVHVVRVFTDETGSFGNPVGIIIDERRSLSLEQRQAIATNLNFSESVFINDLEVGDVSIFSPIQEIPFAGHALVGTSWLIAKLKNKPINSLIASGKKIVTTEEDGLTWIVVNLETTPTPPWHHEMLNSVDAVVGLNPVATPSRQHTYVWAWIDQSLGKIRARTFAPDWGIPEDQANGSGSMQLAAKLAYPHKLEILHGEGSIIYAYGNNTVPEAGVGGRVIEDRLVTY